MNGSPAQPLSITAKQVRFEFLTAQLVMVCAAEEISLVCFRFISTFEEDLAHFLAGRSKIDPRIRKTMHMERLAKDFAVVEGGTLVFEDGPEYKRMGEIAESLGLRSGRRWESLGDIFHVEYQEGA